MFDYNQLAPCMMGRVNVKIRNKRINSLLQLLTLALCCEVFYSPGSGAFNMYILPCVSAVVMLAILFTNVKMLTRGIDVLIWMFIIIWTMLWGTGKEPFRYAMTFVIIYAISGLYVGNMRRLHIVLIIVGAILSVQNILLDHDRATGYMLSPTIYSLQTAISMYYLLENKQRKRHDLIYCLVGFAMIVLTFSRTNILAGGGILVYYYVKNLYLKSRKQLPIARIVLYSFVGCAAVVLISIIDIKSLMDIRSNAQDSTNTRMYWITLVLNQMAANHSSYLIGLGGGYAAGLLSAGAYVPMHQDLMLFACEYGLVYFVLLFFQINKKYHLSLVEWALIIVGSFHNLFLSSVTVLLFFATIRSLRRIR